MFVSKLPLVRLAARAGLSRVWIAASLLPVSALCAGQPAQQLPSYPTPPQPVSVGPADTLTLAQAMQIGLQNNPQMTAAHYAVRSALENYKSEAAPINPTFEYAALNNTVAPLNWDTGFSQGANYSAYLTLETNGAQNYRARQYREAWHQSQFDAATTGLSLKLAILNAYVGLQAAKRALEVEMTVYGNMKKLADLTQKRFEVGSGPQSDSIRAKIAEIQEAENVITDVSAVNQARATLNNQLGRPQNSPIDVAEPLVYRKISVAPLMQLMDEAQGARPEIRSALANLASLRAIPGLNRSEYFPDVVLAKDFGSDGQIFIGASIPLDLGSIGHSISKANADAKSQAAQVVQERQAVELDVRSSWESFDAAQRQIDTYDSGILSMSQTLLDQVQHGYELGANSIVDLITAENTYRSVESSYYAAVGTYVQAAYTLKHSIGELPDNFPTAPVTEIGRMAFNLNPDALSASIPGDNAVDSRTGKPKNQK